jgi:hypothetical protein
MLTRTRLALCVAVASTAVLAFSGSAFAQSPGTWKLNLAKSTFSGPPPKSTTLKYESIDAGIKATVDSVLHDGAAVHYEYRANFDGKDTPVVGDGATRDTSARTRVNANTTKAVNKKDGRITTTQTFVVSPDGKMLTITATGTDASGQAVNNVAVYDKQ